MIKVSAPFSTTTGSRESPTRSRPLGVCVHKAEAPSMRPTLWWDDVIPEARGRAPAARRLTVERLEDRTVPGFLAPVNYAVNESPGAVAVADINADGRPDLVTTTSYKS